MKRAMTMLLSFLMIGSSCFADPSLLPNATFLKKGQPSPYDGVLLSTAQAKVVYGELKDYDRLKLINVSLQKSIEDYKENETEYLKEITEVRDQNLELQQAVEKASTNGFWKDAMWFGIGFLLSGVTVHFIDKH